MSGGSKSVYPMLIDEPSTFACTRDPDRWTTTADEGELAESNGFPVQS